MEAVNIAPVDGDVAWWAEPLWSIQVDTSSPSNAGCDDEFSTPTSALIQNIRLLLPSAVPIPPGPVWEKLIVVINNIGIKIYIYIAFFI